MSRPAFSLSKKAFLAVFVILLPIFIIFIYSYKRNRTLVTNQFLDNLAVMAEIFEEEVLWFVERTKIHTEDFASDGFISDSLVRHLKGRSGAARTLTGHLKKNKLPIDPNISDIYVIGLDGSVIASTDEPGRDFSREPFFQNGKQRLSTSEVKIDGTHGLMVSAPVRSRETGKPLGVIASFIGLSELNKILSGEMGKELGALSRRASRKETLEAYLVNKDRLMITGSRFIKDSILKTRVDTEPVGRCLSSGSETNGFYKDYRGIEVAGASMCIPELGWTLLVEIDAQEVLTPIRAMRVYSIITWAVVAGFIGLLFLVFLRKFVLQLKRISAAAAAIGSGDYGTNVPVESNDELGTVSESFNRMVSEIKARTVGLRENEERLKEAQRIARLGSWDWNIADNRLVWSDEIYSIFGLKPHEFGATYESFINSVHPDDRDFVKESVHHAVYGKKPYSIDHRIVLPDGTEKIVHEQGDVSFGKDGKPMRMVGTVQDITERKRAELELKKLSAAIEHSVNIVFITDANGTIEYVNPTFELITGYSKEDVIGQTPRILSSDELPQEQYEELWKTILAGKTWRGSYKNKKKTGGYYWCNSVISPIRDDEGRITHFLAVQEDTTEKMLSEERIQFLANHDDLTGLINRTRFIELLDEWFTFAEANKLTGALFIIDMDEFKLLNNTYGHGIGDEYLRRFSSMFKLRLDNIYSQILKKPEKPLLARLSGDEFALFIPDADENTSLVVAEQIRASAEEFKLSDTVSSLTVSTGIAIYPAHGTDSKDLFTRADAAMYRAKELGRNRVHLYNQGDKGLEMMHTRLAWKERIQKALKEGRFEAWIQPVLSLADNKVHHFECLARLRGEDGKVLLPGAFIDIAERFGLIGSIDRAIIEQGMRLQAASRKAGRAISFGMNLSGKDLGDEDLLIYLKNKIPETGADPGKLVFEITETAAIGDLGRAKKFIKSLRELGCRFALDDFGVGFTSFTYLQEMQVNYIKIDGSFIKKLHENPNDQVFVKAMTDIARGLKIESVAEFVETAETVELLRAFGVDHAQGYHIGKPAPPDTLKEFLKGDEKTGG